MGGHLFFSFTINCKKDRRRILNKKGKIRNLKQRKLLIHNFKHKDLFREYPIYPPVLNKILNWLKDKTKLETKKLRNKKRHASYHNIFGECKNNILNTC